MQFSISKKRRLPFFQIELSLELESTLTSEFDFAALFANLIPEIPADKPLCELSGQILVNVRGREGEERLLELKGLSLDEEEEEKEFEAVLFSKFYDFEGDSIRHKLLLNTPVDLSHLKLKELCQNRVVLFKIGVEYFRPRTFTFLGNRIPELKERLELTIDSENKFWARLIDFDYKELSLRANTQLEILGRLCQQHNILDELAVRLKS